MTSNRLARWGEIETLSQEIFELADQGHWEEIPELAAKRQQMIEAFFSQPVANEIAPEIAAGIKRIQNRDDATVILANKSRKKISTHLSEIAKGKTVIQAYANNTPQVGF